jgi:hypothetical protein
MHSFLILLLFPLLQVKLINCSTVALNANQIAQTAYAKLPALTVTSCVTLYSTVYTTCTSTRSENPTKFELIWPLPQNVLNDDQSEYSLIHSMNVPSRALAQKSLKTNTENIILSEIAQIPLEETTEEKIESTTAPPNEKEFPSEGQEIQLVFDGLLNENASFQPKNLQLLLNSIEAVKEAFIESIYALKYPSMITKGKTSSKSVKLVVQLAKFINALNGFFVFSQIHQKNDVSGFTKALETYNHQTTQNIAYIKQELKILDSRIQNTLLESILFEFEQISSTNNAAFIANYLLEEMYNERFTEFPVFDLSRTHFNAGQIIEQLESIHSLLSFSEEIIAKTKQENSNSAIFQELSSLAPPRLNTILFFLEGSIKNQISKLLNRYQTFHSRFDQYLSSLPEVKFYRQEINHCKICQAENTDEKRFRCGHKFHQECIFRRLVDEKNLECPLCGQIISPSLWAEQKLIETEVEQFQSLVKKFIVNAFHIRSLACSTKDTARDFVELGQHFNSDISELFERIESYFQKEKEIPGIEVENSCLDLLLKKTKLANEKYTRDSTFYIGMWHLREFFKFKNLFTPKDLNEVGSNSAVEEETRIFFDLDIEVPNEK